MKDFWPTSAPYVKIAAGWAQDQPYCPEDLAGGRDVPEGTKCPGEAICPGLRHKTANWVISRVMDALAKDLEKDGWYLVKNIELPKSGLAQRIRKSEDKSNYITEVSETTIQGWANDAEVLEHRLFELEASNGALMKGVLVHGVRKIHTDKLKEHIGDKP